MPIEVNQPLPVQGALNVRELGGYAATGDTRTKRHVFLRGAQLHNLTEAGEEYLDAYGVRLIIDLRSDLERMLQPDHYPRRDMREVHIPLLNRVEGDIAKDEFAHEQEKIPKSLAGIYVMIVETEQENIARVLRDLIASEGCALFHCTNGKDRTGIIAMFLLEMAGVPRQTIIADYAASAGYLGSAASIDTRIQERLPKGIFPADAAESRPEFMEHLLEHLDREYGSPVEYLRTIGITDTELRRLKDKFVIQAP